MKKLLSIIFVSLLLGGNAYSKDTPYMKLLNSYEGVDRMLVCTPLMQKEFIHTLKMTGDCVTTTKTKQF